MTNGTKSRHPTEARSTDGTTGIVGPTSKLAMRRYPEKAVIEDSSCVYLRSYVRCIKKIKITAKIPFSRLVETSVPQSRHSTQCTTYFVPMPTECKVCADELSWPRHDIW